ncbi:uncharacterized protein YeaO (DUF488 family) [Prauserella isguenensis]|uniref:Uncharacterized protein YeaO (DUF488 family) n=1 Tax=Prauserella isguenensis TaxID=1470180 RepID=A0A839RZG6_9PSEU|nr:DUF488 family protein [Prauserella isguenensis]MBB3050493.1 uncharacterized protein YeaO (DUF488 family) [Prauserella isguenensis]
MADRAVQVRRIYEDPRDDDGDRVLVDRVWPRGVKKESTGLDEWAKAVAPSTDLRKWYGHDPERFAEFRRRYRRELTSGDAAEAARRLRERADAGRLTLLTATKDVAHSHAQVLADLLTEDA